MSKKDIKAMIKDLKKNELTELISVAQEVLIKLFCDWKIIEYFVQYNKVRNCYIIRTTCNKKNNHTLGISIFNY